MRVKTKASDFENVCTTSQSQKMGVLFGRLVGWFVFERCRVLMDHPDECAVWFQESIQ